MIKYKDRKLLELDEIFQVTIQAYAKAMVTYIDDALESFSEKLNLLTKNE
jgi:hypothetical protein